ncbi:sushi, von Willebrand factor type A, EGF and pentraxin domain-containing protein 1 [Procambarus clarkii]|uniref:sushi, von Willebrand factor type A, EGF and pentraxin domain-containing protein 1 n=1 Tax=Procambarus clarkii TaxID=6728 RepID=UPI003743361D
MVFPRLPAGVLVLLLLAGVSESVPCPKPGPKGTIVKVLIKDMVQAWTCPKAGQVWSTGGSVLTVYCTINGQNASSATCGAPPANTQSCNGSMIPVVANASSTALVTDAAYYYTCDNGTAWISNDVAHVSQCLTNGNFSPIFDFCDEGCEPPRDCSSVMVLGMKVSGEYRIIPTGQPNDPGINAWCDLAENSTNEVERFAEGGWTLLLRHLTSNGVMSGDFMAGFILNTSSTDTEYFMGSNHVLDLSTSIDGCIGCRPLVLKELRWGDWTTASIYNISSGVVSEAEKPSTAPGWRLLTVPDNLTVAPSFKAAQLSGNGANIAICQYLGPIGCWDAPQEPLGNMTRSYWDWEMTDIFSNVAYICYPGYFFAGNISQPTLTVECLGQVGGWCPRTFNACLAVEVCMDVPMAPSPLITNSTSPNWRFLNGTVNFTCPALMATQKNMTVQTLTCSYNGNYSFVNATVDPCNVCLGEPKVGNATTNWSNSTLWAVNTTVTATCLTNYMATINTSNLTVACTETGWQTSPPCYLGCSTPPPDAGANMTMSNYTSNAINSVVTYTCNPSLYVPPDKNYTKAMATVNVTCSSNSQWVTLGPALWCTSLCLGDPVPAPASANSSWDGYTRTNGTTVVYTCGGSLLFGNLSSTINITCQDGNWTAIDQSIFLCREAATQPPPTLPAGAALPGQNSSTSSAYNTTQYWKGSTINVTCEPGKISPSGLNYTSTTFNGSAWSPLDPAFTCLPVAEDAPPPLPSGAMLAGPPAPFWVGQTLNYTCQAGTLPTTNQTYVSTTYNGTAWSPIDPKFICGMYTCR